MGRMGGRMLCVQSDTRTRVSNACNAMTQVRAFLACIYSQHVRPPLSATRAPDVVVGDAGDGTCRCEWVPTVKGRHVISVTLGGMPIENSDFPCSVV